MSPPSSERRSAATGDGDTSATPEQAGGFPDLEGGGRGVGAVIDPDGVRRWRYRDRWWSDLSIETLDAILARTGAPAAVRAAGGGAPAPGSLPCHTADKCIKSGNGYSRTAREIRATIGSFVARWGLERLGFMTHTFAGEAPTIKEARRRWRSMRVNALDGRYHSWLCVLQRGKFGRLHFHLVVVCRQDIRTGFDFEAVKRKDYESASDYLRGEWKFWREACPKYHFGRSELLPVRTDAERAARYVARYISRHLRARYPADKRARLVSFADNARENLGRHRLGVETGGSSERRLGGLIHDLGLSGIGELRSRLGRSWRRKLARLLDPDEITEKDFWRIVGESRIELRAGANLEKSLAGSTAVVTAETGGWQMGF